MSASALPTRRCKVAIVGAGPQALTVAVHLAAVDPSIVEDTVVIDPDPGWMSAWRQRFDAQQIQHLRSPVVHQPAPNPFELMTYARDRHRDGELVGRYQLPGARLFDDFCDHLVERHGLARCRRNTKATRVAADGTIDLADGTAIHARHVVVANSPTRRIVPDGCGLIGAVAHADTVRIDSVRPGTRVAVVGAGLTAAHLVNGAAGCGAHVTWVHRSPLVERDFDVDPGWLGPREMQPFLAVSDSTERARLAISARSGGTLPGWMVQKLALHLRAGTVAEICGMISRIETAGSTQRVVLEHRSVVVDEVWLATGHRVAVRDDPALTGLLADSDCLIASGFPVLDSLVRVPGTRVHLAGRAATLQLGPTAGNLSGARHAATAVVAAVFGMDEAMELTERSNTDTCVRRPNGVPR